MYACRNQGNRGTAFRFGVVFFAIFLLAACETQVTNGDEGDGDVSDLCGNDHKDEGEVCDGLDLAGQGCEAQGFGPGLLACRPDCTGFDTSTCSPATTCGNDFIDMGEFCDGMDLGGQSCVTLGFGPGALSCKLDCLDYDRSQCRAPVTCGNGRRDGAELCDDGDLNGATCQTLGFGGGELACLDNCGDYDTSGCAASLRCGNGEIDAGETCDETALAGQTCESLGFGAGALACQTDCKDFDRRGCGAPLTCGNGGGDGVEVCDGEDLDGKTCVDLGFTGGELACNGQCTAFDTSGCTSGCTPECGERECGPDPVCGESCGDCDEYSTCDEAGQCVEICNLDPIDADRTLTIDLKTADVVATFTLDGETMPDNSQSNARGYLVFSRIDSGGQYWVGVGDKGQARIEATIFTGVYDLFFEGGGEDYQDVLPDQKILLERGRSFSADETLSFDLKTIRVSGDVTLNGRTMPDNDNSNERGYLVFGNRGTGDAYWLGIGATGAAHYSKVFFAANYDVHFSGADEDYQDVLPEQRIVLFRERSLTRDATLDADLKTVRIDGDVTLNGQAMPDSGGSYDRGWVVFSIPETGNSYWVGVGANNAAAYEATVFAETYTILFAGGDDDYQDVLPYQRLQIAAGRALTSNQRFDIDLKTVRVSGTFTLDGERMPDSSNSYDRGYAVFTGATTGWYHNIGIGASGPASFDERLFADTYDVVFSSTDDDYQTVLPYLKTRVAKALALNADRNLSYDLRTVQISGAITLDGQTMPDNGLSSNGRGSLGFRSRNADSTLWLSIPATGAAVYSTALFAGDYDILYSPWDRDYQDVTPLANVQSGRAVTFDGNTMRNIDLTTHRLSLTLTLNGQTMPGNGSENDRGSLGLTMKETGDTDWQAVGIRGAAKIDDPVFEGAYDVRFSAYDADYQNVLPPQDILLKTGCFRMENCELNPADLSGAWYAIPSAPWWTPVSLALVQNADGAIEGAFYSSGYTGIVFNGRREGDKASFEFQPYCLVHTEGTLLNGCMMTGTMEARNCASTVPFSQFVAFRLE
ncbi:MAG: hypothetical protein C4523_03495 [Myxococcales bacterium]|nr:MAG: hypothetical protein C4523_03495 [Myxococcales bacterium]